MWPKGIAARETEREKEREQRFENLEFNIKWNADVQKQHEW